MFSQKPFTFPNIILKELANFSKSQESKLLNLLERHSRTNWINHFKFLFDLFDCFDWSENNAASSPIIHIQRHSSYKKGKDTFKSHPNVKLQHDTLCFLNL